MSEKEPDRSVLLDLHRRVCAGDGGAAELAELLVAALRIRFRGQRPSDETESLIGWHVAGYLAEPHRFDPARGDLLGWLYVRVEGFRMNAGRKAAKQWMTMYDPDEINDLIDSRTADPDPPPAFDVEAARRVACATIASRFGGPVPAGVPLSLEWYRRRLAERVAAAKVDDSLPSSFGEALRTRRVQLGLSQENVGMLLGVHLNAVSAWETEKAYPKATRLRDVRRLFGLAEFGGR